MILYEKDNLKAEGNAQELTKEWMQLTHALCKGLSKEMGCEVTVELLMQGGTMLLKQELEENTELLSKT